MIPLEAIAVIIGGRSMFRIDFPRQMRRLFLVEIGDSQSAKPHFYSRRFMIENPLDVYHLTELTACQYMYSYHLAVKPIFISVA